ncbi:hypothetical protein [Rhizobium leguminosarum]|uniref:hypothetical protein n=1 Tax=Rhizobium leguminosarum TaxID=384 RepID=UPI001AEBE636|nr:hypothetical protein [Rhizobium leguminosarum]
MHRRAKISAGANGRPGHETQENGPDDGDRLVELQAVEIQRAKTRLLVRWRDVLNDKLDEIGLVQRGLSRHHRKPTEPQGAGAQGAGRGAQVRLFGGGSILRETFTFAAADGARLSSSLRQLERIFQQPAGSKC